MWCCCCTPEEHVDWKNGVENVIKNLKEVERLGEKCITNKLIGRKNYYVENDILDYFSRVDRSLFNLKKQAVDFLVTNSSFEQLQHTSKQNSTRQMQTRLLQLKQYCAELTNENGRDGRQQTKAPQSIEGVQQNEENKNLLKGENESESVLAIQNELILNLNQQLSKCEDEIELITSQIKNFESRWQAEGYQMLEEEGNAEEEPSVTRPPPEEHQEYDEGPDDNSILNDEHLSIAQNLFGRILNNFKTDAEEAELARESYNLLPVENDSKIKQPKKKKDKGKDKPIKNRAKKKNKPQKSDKTPQENNEEKGNSRLTDKFSKKVALLRNKATAETTSNIGSKDEKLKVKRKKSDEKN